MPPASLGLLALAALQDQSDAAAREVTQLPSDQVAAAFLKGMPLVEKENYKVHASRREAPGQVEVHTKDTDIIYVLTGTRHLRHRRHGGRGEGTSSPRRCAATRSTEGRHGRSGPGEVVIVPSGTPHWFKEVPAPMTYYVVKVRAAGDAR